jgi:hypothetical protein
MNTQKSATINMEQNNENKLILENAAYQQHLQKKFIKLWNIHQCHL